MIVKIENVSKIYDEVPIVTNVSLMALSGIFSSISGCSRMYSSNSVESY